MALKHTHIQTNISFKSILQNGISQPEFCGDQTYKFIIKTIIIFLHISFKDH